MGGDDPNRDVVARLEELTSQSGWNVALAPGTQLNYQVDRANLLRVLRSYLDANKLEADWTAIQRASSEFLINALCVMCPYGPEEKQALLEAEDLRCRADVLVALAEMELASSGGSGSTLQ